MYIKSVKLINFKSIGDTHNSEIILEPKITTIIGKNESGKSNVIEGLSLVNLMKKNDNAFSDNLINRNSGLHANIKYVITLIENKKKSNVLSKEIIIEITKDSYKATGGIIDYYKNKILPNIESLKLIIDELGFKAFEGQNLNHAIYIKYYNCFFDFIDSIDIPLKNDSILYFDDLIKNCTNEKQKILLEMINLIKSDWDMIFQQLPSFYLKKNEKTLKSKYEYEEVKKELYNSNESKSLLGNLVELIEIDKDEFILASSHYSNGKQVSIRAKIKREIDEKINSRFQDFYKTEKIYLDVDFNSGEVIFSVRSENGETLMFSERSNGLRWYLETFIEVQSKKIFLENTVFLFDEPGIFLHVNAQKELIKLFNHLSEKGSQVVFCTHSPFMLDIDGHGIHRIRAVIKDINGITSIYKTAYDNRIDSVSKNETLSPIINAIGMNLNDTFGPSNDKMNIVVEGISDYIYLKMMGNLLKIDLEKINFVPSIGATNVKNICSILHGWGCSYFALLDFDIEGVREGEILKKELLLDYKKQYCYYYDADDNDVINNKYKSYKFLIEDIVGKEEIDKFCKEKNVGQGDGKALIAKLMSNYVENNEYELGEQCKSNFKELFTRILKYIEKK